MLKTRPEEAFAYVSDLTRHPEWSGGPLKVEALTSGSIGVGSLYRSTGGQGDRINDLCVTAYVPPNRFAFVAKDQMGDVTHEIIFNAQDGGTLMERKVTGAMPLMVSILFRAFIYPMRGKPLMDKAMANLKAKWEQPVQQSRP
jgi:hypothetical protein